MTMYTPPGDDTSVLYFSRAGAELGSKKRPARAGAGSRGVIVLTI